MFFTFSLCILDHFSDIFRSGFWRGLQNLPPEGFILRLTDSLQSTVLSSKAISTTVVYHRAFRKWKDFATSKLHSCTCPASPCHVALYLQHLIDESHSPCVVDSDFYGIKWAHTMAGIPSPTDNPVVEAVRCASKRILGTRVVNRKEPISSSVIYDLIGLADLQNPVHLRNVTMYVLSFAGFFRFDVSRIRRNDIFFHEGFMVIKVLKSKNDQLRKGDEVIFSEISGPACPVKLLKTYLAHFSIPSSSRDLIFRPISRGKNSFKLVSQDKPISYTTIRAAFRRDLRSVGVTLPLLVFIPCVREGPLLLLIMGLVTGCFRGTAAGSPFKPKMMDDDLEKRLLVSKSLGL